MTPFFLSLFFIYLVLIRICNLPVIPSMPLIPVYSIVSSEVDPH